MSKYIRILTILMVMLLSFEMSTWAQTAQDPPPFDSNTNDLVPIDGGLILLLAAGIAYGSKKMYDVKKSDH